MLEFKENEVQLMERRFAQLYEQNLKQGQPHLAPAVLQEQFNYFMYVAAARGLNPLLGQIEPIWRANKMICLVRIDGARKLAQDSGMYRGQLGPFWKGKTTGWQDFWDDDEPPSSCKVGIVVDTFPEPIWGIANFKEYGLKEEKDYKTGEVRIAFSSPMWKSGSSFMIAKCAEMIGLRRAFPSSFSSLYIQEEINDHETLELIKALPQTAPPVKATQVVKPTTMVAANGRSSLPNNDIKHDNKPPKANGFPKHTPEVRKEIMDVIEAKPELHREVLSVLAEIN